jgi:hypothetical protein
MRPRLSRSEKEVGNIANDSFCSALVSPSEYNRDLIHCLFHLKLIKYAILISS